MKMVMRSRKAKALLVMLALLALCSSAAFAGAGDVGGAEFSPIYDWIKGAVKGVLGRLIALVMIVTGVAMGIARGSIFAFVTGICAGIGFFFAPDILEALTGASLAIQ